MKLGPTLKLTVAVAAVVCAMGVVVTSTALAHTWAPVSTVFEGKNTSAATKLSWPTAHWECNKDTLKGTTASTASASLGVTPTFSSCVFEPGGLATNWGFECVGKPSWTLTLGTGSTGTVTFNCPFEIEAPAVGCAVRGTEQANLETFTWTNVGTKEGVQIKFAVKKIKTTSNHPFCEESLGGAEAEFTGTYEIKNVYVS